MTKGIIVNIAMVVILLGVLGAAIGCDAVRGGAEVHLQNVSVGNFSQSGKAITGIPTGNIDAVLKVNTDKVYINSTADGFVITLSPSNAVITATKDGLAITGVTPEQIDLQFAPSATTK
jgi:hypothetical protein